MKHREIVNRIIEEGLDKEVKEVKVQFDGRQFIIKIPTEFSNLLALKKGDKFKLTLPIPETGSIRKSKITAEVVEDD